MTDRLYLRLTEPEQIGEAFLEMFADLSGKNRYFRLSGREFTREELVQFCQQGIERQDTFYYSVCAVADDAVIGCVRLGPIDFKHSIADMVALIGDVTDRGKGLGTEAIMLGNQIAFQRHNVRKLSGGVLAPNIGSYKAYTRAGWVEEGRLAAHYLVDGEYVDWITISALNPHWRSEAGHAATEPVCFQVPGEPETVQTVPVRPFARGAANERRSPAIHAPPAGVVSPTSAARSTIPNRR